MARRTIQTGGRLSPEDGDGCQLLAGLQARGVGADRSRRGGGPGCLVRSGVGSSRRFRPRSPVHGTVLSTTAPGGHQMDGAGLHHRSRRRAAQGAPSHWRCWPRNAEESRGVRGRSVSHPGQPTRPGSWSSPPVGLPDPASQSAAERNAPRRVRGLAARLDGFGWYEGRRHLFVVNVEDGATVQVTKVSSTTPTRPSHRTAPRSSSPPIGTGGGTTANSAPTLAWCRLQAAP